MGNNKKATFGGGCFWCIEAIFLNVDGVIELKSGYMGGNTKNPTYEEVCTGTTGHAEVIEISYDKEQVDFDELLKIFFKTHDPTTLNRQGNDVGTQYRSVVFYHDQEQKEQAEKMIESLTQAGVFESAIVTQVVPAEHFWIAEDYHKNYFELNPQNPYCAAVIAPKVQKFLSAYGK